MDPITQGVVGATASQLVSPREQKMAAALLGVLSGMAADLDVLINSPVDPLLFLEFHRHFTHSLFFIPVGALLCAAFYKLIFRRSQLGFRTIYFYCLAGYATHALLDACTTYGTQLLWPFSDMRVAWNVVSVVDPLFTVPLLIMIVLAVRRRSTRLATIGAAYALSYLALGAVQNHRAYDQAERLAQARGHQAANLGVKPSFGNILVFKSVYEHQGQYFVDAVRVGTTVKVYPGTKVDKLVLEQHFPWLQRGSQQALDVERFRWFSNNHLGLDPHNANRIIDIRYSLIPNQITGMWGIVLDPTASDKQHVDWTSNRPKGRKAWAKIQELWVQITDSD